MIIIKTEDCKTEMLVTWLRQTREASWSTVVRALVGIRKGALAQKVALEYGEPHHMQILFRCHSHVTMNFLCCK